MTARHGGLRHHVPDVQPGLRTRPLPKHFPRVHHLLFVPPRSVVTVRDSLRVSISAAGLPERDLELLRAQRFMNSLVGMFLEHLVLEVLRILLRRHFERAPCVHAGGVGGHGAAGVAAPHLHLRQAARPDHGYAWLLLLGLTGVLRVAAGAPLGRLLPFRRILVLLLGCKRRSVVRSRVLRRGRVCSRRAEHVRRTLPHEVLKVRGRLGRILPDTHVVLVVRKRLLRMRDVECLLVGFAVGVAIPLHHEVLAGATSAAGTPGRDDVLARGAELLPSV